MSTAQCPGSCGELFQGKINGIPTHITCPIERYSRSTAKLYSRGIKVPHSKHKVAAAVAMFLKKRKLPAGVEISLSSDLVAGKGMSSSSADIFSALSATANLFSSPISPGEMAAIALSVESTDGVFLEGIAIFDHYSGLVAKTIDDAPRLGVVLLDFGGYIDTVDFASHSIQYQPTELLQLAKAFALVKNGIIKKNYHMLGAGSILSARINQRYLFKPQLEAVISAAANCDVYGVNVAHSGTIIGVLTNPLHLDDYRKRFAALFPSASVSGANITSGGVLNNTYSYC